MLLLRWKLSEYFGLCAILGSICCHVHTDHEALKSLLNGPHPSGKLARWGLAIQELDLVNLVAPIRKLMHYPGHNAEQKVQQK